MRGRLRLRATALSRTDVIVLGGGPAGCAAATLLARRSHRVVMVCPEAPTAGDLAVSIPPSARRVLDELGALAAVESAGLYPNHGNSVCWAEAEPRTESFRAEAAGYHTDRTGLEVALRGVAETAGVRVLSGHLARSAVASEVGWSIRCDGPEGAHTLDAHWVIDATGRHGLIARKEGREPDRSTTTLAVVRRWRRPGGWPEADRHRTFIESYPTGWAWSVPLADDLRCYTVMIDQRDADVGSEDLGRVLERELGTTRLLGRSREGAEAVGEAWACPASLYRASRYGREGLLLAGDAGSFIDPLSSYGVKKALSSGWLAGIVANTALIEPEMARTAVDFFDAREREVYRRYRQASVPFFESAARAYATPYWTERADAARRAGGAQPGSRPGDPSRDPDAIGPDVPEDEVRAAFDAIRARDVLGAMRGSTLREFEGPGVAGHRIVMERRLATGQCPDGVRYVRGVDLLRLVDAATANHDVPDGWTAYNDTGPAVTLPDYLTALSTAFAMGILEHDVQSP